MPFSFQHEATVGVFGVFHDHNNCFDLSGAYATFIHSGLNVRINTHENEMVHKSKAHICCEDHKFILFAFISAFVDSKTIEYCQVELHG